MTRRDAPFTDPVTRVLGNRLLVNVEDDDGRVILQLPAIERGPPYMRLPIDIYTVRMDIWRPKGNPEKPANSLRVLGFAGPSGNSVHLHPANWPHQLEGCIAPGLDESDRGVAHSRLAMGQIFKALGGYSMMQEFPLVLTA